MRPDPIQFKNPLKIYSFSDRGSLIECPHSHPNLTPDFTPIFGRLSLRFIPRLNYFKSKSVACSVATFDSVAMSAAPNSNHPSYCTLSRRFP